MGKHIKAHNAQKRKRLNEYKDMRAIFPPECWNCKARFAPKFWGYAPWLPNERAHIVVGKRLQDRRCVVLLCSTCHKMFDGQADFSQHGLANELTVEKLLNLKERFDPDYFDLDLLAECSIRNLPRRNI